MHTTAQRLDSQPDQRAIQQPGVSELIIPSWEQASLELVLPMLAHLSHQAHDRWLTWIGNPPLTRIQIKQHAFSDQNLRVIKSRNDDEVLWMMWDALNNGTSSFVVGCIKECAKAQDKERRLLEQACFAGSSRALIIKQPALA